MDRLTERDEYGNADIIGVDSGDLQLNLRFDEFNRVTDVLNRLAAYEDTDLTPEICANYKKFEDEAISKNVTFNRIVELMEAEAEGRLIVLPCAAGDEVWVIDRDEDDGKPLDYSGYVFITAINNYAIVSPFIMNSGDINDILEYQIDNFSSDLITVPLKDCYFTPEAAAAALKEAQG